MTEKITNNTIVFLDDTETIYKSFKLSDQDGLFKKIFKDTFYGEETNASTYSYRYYCYENGEDGKRVKCYSINDKSSESNVQDQSTQAHIIYRKIVDTIEDIFKIEGNIIICLDLDWRFGCYEGNDNDNNKEFDEIVKCVNEQAKQSGITQARKQLVILYTAWSMEDGEEKRVTVEKECTNLIVEFQPIDRNDWFKMRFCLTELFNRCKQYWNSNTSAICNEITKAER